MRDKKILRLLTLLGFALFPFMLRKQPIKDWLLVYIFKAFYSGFIDSFVVSKKKIDYPVRLLPKVFKIHVVFDFILFPIACVFYNQLTFHASLKDIFAKVFYFSIPITLVEVWAAANTKLIQYKKWNWFYSFSTLTLTFWLVRVTIAVIRKIDNTTKCTYKAT